MSSQSEQMGDPELAGHVSQVTEITAPESEDELWGDEHSPQDLAERRFLTRDPERFERVVEAPGLTPTVKVPYSRRLLDNVAVGEGDLRAVRIERFAPRVSDDDDIFCGMCGMQYLVQNPTIELADEHLADCTKYPYRQFLEHARNDKAVLEREVDAFDCSARVARLVASYGMYRPGGRDVDEDAVRDLLKAEGQRLSKLEAGLLGRVKIILGWMVPHSCYEHMSHPRFDWCMPCVVWEEIHKGGFKAYWKAAS